MVPLPAQPPPTLELLRREVLNLRRQFTLNVLQLTAELDELDRRIEALSREQPHERSTSSAKPALPR